uniref:Subtilisin-like protease n=1 Tax=Kalanchoe fedtschenkoi TaxID=63787 RepID=A0A7N0VLT2_KALFE
SYIVYMGTHSHGLNPTDADAELATQSHYNLLGSLLGSYERAQESVSYSYNKYINGFAASLTEQEVEAIKKSPNVVSVFPNKPVKLHTTRSWEFLGLEHDGITPPDSLWNISGYGQDTIIGTLDTGVWPESRSFSDEGLEPVPSRWKGACVDESDNKVICNKKLIGARYFGKGYEEAIGIKLNKSSQSARDNEGHGTHTLSTAGGSFVKRASIFGLGAGVAKGGSPRARVASYKVCWHPVLGYECVLSDIMAGFEAAIGDGVDVLSVSLGGDAAEYKDDGIAIGAFHAVRNGITVVASAGNSGPWDHSVSNIAPWIFTIGASTFDRGFTNWVSLGNKRLHFKGASLGSKLLPERKFYPLIAGASAYVNGSGANSGGLCKAESLDPSKVKGKIVVCRRGEIGKVVKGMVVKAAGGVGMILINDKENGDAVSADVHVLPASHLSYQDGLKIEAHINTVKNPYAHITYVRTELGLKPAPVMAFFSSRGPNPINPQLLKPDVTAPGVNVIAAFSGSVGPSGDGDTRRVAFYVQSGTSMSCPHVAGVVGLLKTLHPDWSPAAIRSAIMTTATTVGNDDKPILDSNGAGATPLAYGAGHINPNAAASPGLVYDVTEDDYLDFLCATGSYTENDLKAFSPKPHKCSGSKNLADFNYPSITITNFTSSATVTRTVKNVGQPATYKATVTAPQGVSVTVAPSELKFSQTGEAQTFSVSFKVTGKSATPHYEFGSLIWSDGKQAVRSPIVVELV